MRRNCDYRPTNQAGVYPAEGQFSDTVTLGLQIQHKFPHKTCAYDPIFYFGISVSQRGVPVTHRMFRSATKSFFGQVV